ncbi:HAMP domain-containing protein [Parapedobacter sp. ISTM3]|uniref:HAMP domain-containing sensor histidine kinase n=1 Tax=Parapedobacter sp. ISTM3 TaxID=2800130 RepID=UPI001907E2BC|nr:ATP-binding protein [Parapedobacter sp. ISTM3]MBK1438577.1 HAMP domain-containing protein [Parapedobacter sp. ISTM3]
MRKSLMNTQTKIAVMLIVAFLAIIMLFSGWVYFAIPGFLHDYYYDVLEIRAVAAGKMELDKDQRGLDDLRSVFSEKLMHEQDYFFKIEKNKDFKNEADSLGIPLSFFETALNEGGARYQDKQLFYVAVVYPSKQGNYVIVSQAQDYFEESFVAYLKKTLVAAIIIAFCVSLFIAVYYSKYIFKPLREITEKVQQISSENLHLRLDSRNSNDEMDELIHTFNDMLNRIETAFETQNNFISNASHELRTPLTAIIGEADVALSKDRTPEEYKTSIKVMLEEAEKLDAKTNALLSLAQTGFNGKIQRFERLRIDQLIWDVKNTVEKLNPKCNLHIDTSLLPEDPMKLTIKGNEQLLHLALANIIANACKYSDNQKVNVSLGASDDHVVIVVKDKGIGIPADELKYIYDPFFRASNTKNYAGYGIGLPLTRNIIKMHQGKISVSSLQGGGTTVQLTIPAWRRIDE